MNTTVRKPAPVIEGGVKASSLCFVIDPEANFRVEFSNRLRDAGVETLDFSNSIRLLESLDDRTPSVIFIHVNADDPFDSIRALTSLALASFTGQIQLTGRCEPNFLESIKKFGQYLSLTLLPPMKKPMDFSEVRKIVRAQKLVHQVVATDDMTLSEVLTRNLIEFWYQPKADLHNKKIMGAESLLRLLHPMYGVIPPGNFLVGSREDELQELAKLSVEHALRTSINFARQGIPLSIAVNMSVESLLSLPIKELVRKHCPKSGQWQGLVIEIPERQAISRIKQLQAKFPEIIECGVSLALDHCGRGISSFQMLNEFRFSEIKIDSSFVHDCDKEQDRANVCKTIIQMAHNFSAKVTAVGVETPIEVQKLVTYGCDFFQGYLFGKPMTGQTLMEMVTASRNSATGSR